MQIVFRNELMNHIPFLTGLTRVYRLRMFRVSISYCTSIYRVNVTTVLQLNSKLSRLVTSLARPDSESDLFMMEPPPTPSQTNMSTSHAAIFVNKDGSPIKVFTEACGIKGRPKLMRTLRVSQCHTITNSVIKLLRTEFRRITILRSQECSNHSSRPRNYRRQKIYSQLGTR